MRTYDDKYVEEVFNLIPEANFVAVNSDNTVIFCSFKPELGGSLWKTGLFDEKQGWLSKVNLNGLDWKDSLRERKWVPKNNEVVFLADPTDESLVMSFNYITSETRCSNTIWLERGLLFKSYNEAVSASKRMLEAVKKG